MLMYNTFSFQACWIYDITTNMPWILVPIPKYLQPGNFSDAEFIQPKCKYINKLNNVIIL